LKPRTTFIPPRTPIEKGLAETWAEFLDLDLEDVSVNDNFFDLGGHSLMATQVVSRVREIFQIEVPLKLLFSTIFTIEALAMTIEQHLIEQVSAEEIAEMLAELDELSEEEVKGVLADQTI
jgi:acyl carrier protein